MFARVTEWGQVLAQWVGDKVSFGSPPMPLSQQDESQVFDYAALNSILHYESYDPTTKIFHNKNSQGFMLEASPLTGASEETATLFTTLLIDVLPKHADLQIMLWGSDKIGQPLDDFERQRSGKGEIYEWLAKKRTDFLKRGAYKSLISHGVFILRDFRLFLSVSMPIKQHQDFTQELITLRDNMISSLQSIHISTVAVSADPFKSLMKDILHPSNNVYPNAERWNPYDALSAQLIDPEYLMRVYQDRIKIRNAEKYLGGACSFG
jgi:conjugal transfer ATP-binding protein TraC